MKAAVLTRFGPPTNIEIREVPQPKTKPHQVLVRVRATCVTSGDARIRAKNVPQGYGLMINLIFGFNTPRIPILGMSMAGDVVAVGHDVTRFDVGDRVFGVTGFGMGAHAEMVAVKAKSGLAKIPVDIDYEQAATIPFGGTTSRFFLVDRAKLKRGEKILINGASGAVGVAMIQLAKYLGAHVTGVSSPANHALLRELGADEVIDYKSNDISELAGKYDVIADCVGNAPYSRMKHRLKRGGRLLMVVGTLTQALAAPFQTLLGPHKVVGGTSESTPEDLQWLLDAKAAGYLEPVIDSSYSLPDIALAHARVDTSRKVGAVVVTVP